MSNNNSPEKKRRKPKFETLPEERKKGITIRFRPGMKDLIYDVRDWIERVNKKKNKGSKILSLILKWEGKEDEVIEFLSGKKAKESLSRLEELTKIQEELGRKEEEIQRLLQELKARDNERLELEQFRKLFNEMRNLFVSQCKDGNGRYPSFSCVVSAHAKRLLKIP